MHCPDESTIAAFMQGGLGADQVATIELHLDRCPECAALLASLGRVYGPNASAELPSRVPSRYQDAASSDAPSPPTTNPVRPPASATSARGAALRVRSIALLGTLWIAHAAGSLWLLSCLARSLQRHSLLEPTRLEHHLGAEMATWPSGFFTGYLLIWFPVGLVWTVVNAHGLLRCTGWSRRATLAYAILSLPSGLLTPVCAYLLWALTRPELAAGLAHISHREAGQCSREAGSR